jgi:ubiquitin-conjugating enzyme E2 J2
MHTPSGRFRCSERLCLSISDFHPKSFNPAWEVSTILLGVLSFMTSEEMTTGSLSATSQERRALAAQTKWWNSTGGGSTNRTIAGQQPQSSNTRGFGAIKAGDGGKRFKWLEEKKIDPRTGKSTIQPPSCAPEATALRRRIGASTGGLGAVVDGGREVGAAGQGFVRRNAWYIVFGGLFCYVLIMRLVGQQS